MKTITTVHRLIVVAIAFIAVGATALVGGQEQSQLEVFDAPIAKSAPNAYRILFIGDSITRHGTNAAIRKELGWDHVSGMAASSPEKDYVHLLAARIQATMPGRVVEIYYDSQAPRRPLPPDAGQNLRSATVASALYQVDGMRKFHPHLVVIQLGEHDKPSVGEAVFRNDYTRLIRAFDSWSPRPLVICTGVWAPGDQAAGVDYYRGNNWTATIERVIRDVCAREHVPFASVESCALDPDCRGSGTSAGVQWHPNDKGHAGYAAALLKAFEIAKASAGLRP